MSSRPRLLLVGDEPILLQTRQMILGIRFSVDTSARISEAQNFIQNTRYDLIVVCRATENWARLAEIASQQTRAPKVVAVTNKVEDAPQWAHVVVFHKKGPYELLKVCSEMFGISTPSKSRRLPWRRVAPAG